MPANPQEVYFDYRNPLGRFRVCLMAQKISRVQLLPLTKPSDAVQTKKIPAAIKHFLDAYCLGRSVSAQAEWLRPAATDFAQKIYNMLLSVPFGQVTTYGELAQQAGYTAQHARAVGQVMNNNPWPLFVPCHRVISSGNRLGGFGAGLEMKMTLLAHEGVVLPLPHAQPAHFNTPLAQVTYAF